MLTHYITIALILASSAIAQNDSSPKVILTNIRGGSGPTAVPGSASNEAIIAGQTYTVGGPAVTSAGNTINAILTNGVIFNDHTYTYITTDTHSPSPSSSDSTPPSDSESESEGYNFLFFPRGNGTIVIQGTAGPRATLAPGGPEFVSQGHTISAATEGVFFDGTLDPFPSSTRVQTLTFESETITASEVSSRVFAVYTQTVSIGGEAKSVLGQEVSAAVTGVVVATASASESTSSTSGAGRVWTGCWAGLGVCGLLFSLL